MKSPIYRCGQCLAFAVLLSAGALRAQDAAPSPSPAAKSKRALLEDELAMYSPFESPWTESKANRAFESHLFSLMRAEARLWALQDGLAAQNNPAHADADEVSRIVHGQILAGAADALPLLQKTPNKAFALLLVHQLEAYPYEWQEEGTEQLLPDLHKLVDPPPGSSPAPEDGGRRRRHRGSG